MKAQEIANTIQKQIVGTVGINTVWSWGQHGRQFLTEENLIGLGITNSEGALKFAVNGHHHKGHVVVALNGLDTYDVYICSIRKGAMKVKDEAKGLYFDEIGEYIDKQVEYIEAYAS